MTWMDTAAELRGARVPAVLVTLASVRGHAPREAGAKMIVTADDLFGTIGGGNLEMTGLTRARELLAAGQSGPEMLTLRLNDKAPAEYGRQCCGGAGTVLVEPLPLPASAAILRTGNIGPGRTRRLSRRHLDRVGCAAPPPPLEALAGLESRAVRGPRRPRVAGRAEPSGVRRRRRGSAHRASARQPRAHHDPRPRRGPAPVLGCPGSRRSGLDRADRLAGQMAALPQEPRRRRLLIRDHRHHPMPDRTARTDRQGAGHDRRQRGRRPADPHGLSATHLLQGEPL